jgi:pyridoxamine 5'-phosphate oxidase
MHHEEMQTLFRQNRVVEHSEYRKGSLDESALPDDPLEGLSDWIQDARDANAPEPTAMCLATAGLDGLPHARFVLLRGIDPRGLAFYTNYASAKGEELADNPRAAAAFWWPSLERQVRVEGEVVRISAEESDAYFDDRPLESRYASAASPQSQEVPDRATLESMVEDLKEAYPKGPPRPEGWGGFRVVPDRIEFWQGRPARLHDRFLYSRTPEGWNVVRLAP